MIAARLCVVLVVLAAAPLAASCGEESDVPPKRRAARDVTVSEHGLTVALPPAHRLAGVHRPAVRQARPATTRRRTC